VTSELEALRRMFEDPAPPAEPQSASR